MSVGLHSRCFCSYWSPSNATNRTLCRQAATVPLTGTLRPDRVRRYFDFQDPKGPMNLTIYHNPRCSKSRKTLEIIKDSGVSPQVVLYLDEKLGATDILDLASRLHLPVADLLRRGEAAFKDATDLPDLNDDAALAAWVAANPIALQRPIVVDTATGNAVIGRPPENVHELLN